MKNFDEILKINTEFPESLDLYRASIEKMNGVLFVGDYNTMSLNWADDNFKEVTGYGNEEFCNLDIQKLSAIYHPEDLYIFSEMYNYFMIPEANDKTHTAIFRIMHKDGHYIWVYTCCYVISRNPDLSPKNIGGIMINLEKFIIPSSLEKHLNELKREKNKNILDILTKKEKELLSFIAKGLSCSQIAEKLVLSKRTIETHIKNMQNKLGFNNINALICFAISNGFLPE